MAKVINKGLAKANCKMILQSSLIAPVMNFPNNKKKRRIMKKNLIRKGLILDPNHRIYKEGWTITFKPGFKMKSDNKAHINYEYA